MNDIDKLIMSAERSISKILAKLEKDTGLYVDNVSVVNTDITQINDCGSKYIRRTVIETKGLPGTMWDE